MDYLELNEGLRYSQLQRLKLLNIQALKSDTEDIQSQRQECIRLMDYYDRIIQPLLNQPKD